MHEMFESAARAAGDLAGVFEYDGDTGYFYLYVTDEGCHKVADAIHILSGEPDFSESDLSVRWDAEEHKVGLFIKGVLWAAFDSRGRIKYGGGYKVGGAPSMPASTELGF